MKFGIVALVATLVIAVGAGALIAGIGSGVPPDGLPDMSGRFAGKMKIKSTEQLTDGDKIKEKADIVVDVFQRGSSLTAYMGFNSDPIPVCFKALIDDVDQQTIGMSGSVGNGVFSLRTNDFATHQFLIVGTAKTTKKGVKLKMTGLFSIASDIPEAGSLSLNAKRTGDVPVIVIPQAK